MDKTQMIDKIEEVVNSMNKNTNKKFDRKKAEQMSEEELRTHFGKALSILNEV